MGLKTFLYVISMSLSHSGKKWHILSYGITNKFLLFNIINKFLVSKNLFVNNIIYWYIFLILPSFANMESSFYYLVLNILHIAGHVKTWIWPHWSHQLKKYFCISFKFSHSCSVRPVLVGWLVGSLWHIKSCLYIYMCVCLSR